MARVALGFRTHLGWTALVALSGPAASPQVLDRRRLELTHPDVPESLDPYHAARGLDPAEAAGVVHQGTEAARSATRRALRAVVGELREGGHELIGSALLLSSGRLPDSLEATLASHALVHVAEGIMFRDAIGSASEDCALPVTGFREKEVWERGAAALGLPAEKLRAQIDALGQALGPPWREDQKLASLAAWLVLAGVRG